MSEDIMKKLDYVQSVNRGFHSGYLIPVVSKDETGDYF